MSDNPLRLELKSLERRLVLLLDDYRKLKEETKILRVENGRLVEQISLKEQQLSNVKKKDNISKIVNGVNLGDKNSKELASILDEYIREVDKCIAQISE